MTVRGTIINGVAVPQNGQPLPEGSAVEITVIPGAAAGTDSSDLSILLELWAGTAQGLPVDLADNHDHYLYGLPKSE
ncbi:MAG: hypothetical protein FD180_4490 [Planctomycetota bacterium]|nr:MAG: hypothetical protein FD180_4490 [Planctomycetota bacterium]